VDELLDSRVKQLKEIDDRLHRIQKRISSSDFPWGAIESLRYDIADMIRVAEEEYAAF
jgi:predicted nucleic acid-binding OB-fold protein